MIELVKVDETNWQDIACLAVEETQKAFLDTGLGIVARGYAYRGDRAQVIGIARDGRLIGAALVKDLDEAPACYDLQQFMIDRRWQGRGYGTEALRAILAGLARERKYDHVEVCVHRDDAPALHVYAKVGFEDTGYVDEAAPHCRNLAYRFPRAPERWKDSLIDRFTDPAFQAAFRAYFGELGIAVKDWDALFAEMDGDGGNMAWVRTAADGRTIGFIQFKPTTLTSGFFAEERGFIREFWVAAPFCNGGHGTDLLRLAEQHFLSQGIRACMLTTDTAERFYLRHGYEKVPGCKAKNQLDVYVKYLK